MSEGWASRKLAKLKETIEAKKQAENLEYQRRAAIISAARPVYKQLVGEIKNNVDRFNTLREHEEVNAIDIMPLVFNRTPESANVESSQGGLTISLNESVPSIEYTVRKSPNRPTASPLVTKFVFNFVIDKEQVWLQSDDFGGGKVSTTEAADNLLDFIV